MSTIDRLNQEIDSCQHELAVLFPQQITMLGKGNEQPTIQVNGKRVQVGEVVGYISISFNVISGLETGGAFDLIRARGSTVVNGVTHTGAQLEFLVRRQLAEITRIDVTDKATGVKLMSSAITTLAAIVQSIGSVNLGQHKDVLVKYLRTSILWDVGMTADRNIIAFFERLADRISSIFVLCCSPMADHRDAVGIIIDHMRYYTKTRNIPTHSVVMSRVKSFLCGGSLPGCELEAPLPLIKPFRFSEFTSPTFQVTMRLLNIMDILIGLKSGYSRQGSNAVLEVCIKAGKSICTQMENTTQAELLKKVCRSVINSLTSAHSRFSESHTFEQRFGIVLSEIHAGLRSLHTDGSPEGQVLTRFLGVLNELDVLKLEQIKYDLELIGVMHDADYDRGDGGFFTHTFQGFKYNGDIIAVVTTSNRDTQVLSVFVDGLSYPTPTVSEWLRVLAIITDEISSADNAMAGIESDFPMSDD